MGSAWERLRGWFLVLDRLAGSFAKRGIAAIYYGRIRLAVSLMGGEGDGRQVA